MRVPSKCVGLSGPSKSSRGEMRPFPPERTLKQLAPQGITEGSLFVPLDYSRVPQLG